MPALRSDAADGWRALGRSQRASMRARFWNAEFEAEVRVTPAGVVAIGLLVSGILLSVVPIVSAATGPRREQDRFRGTPPQNRLTGK